MDVFSFLEVYSSTANDFCVRTKRGKEHYYNKRKQIRHINVFNIINILILLSADAKLAVLLWVPSTQVRNLPLLHFPRWFCFVNVLFAMSLRSVKRSVICKFQCFCLFNIQQWSILSYVLLSPSQKFDSLPLKPLHFFIFIALEGTSQSLPKNFPC